MRKLTLAIALALLALAAPASATAAPILNLDLHHNQTHFEPGGVGEYWVDVYNIGNDPTTGPITLTVALPSGLTRSSVRQTDPDIGGSLGWSCPGSAGDSVIVCTTADVLGRHRVSLGVIIGADVNPALGSPPVTRSAVAKVEGGGSADAPPPAGCPKGAAACTIEPTEIDPAPAGFGILGPSFQPDFFGEDGLDPEREAGAHPELLTVPFDVHTIDAPIAANPLKKVPPENLRDLTVDLPPGFVGNPTAVGECSAAQFNLSVCPTDSQVGWFFARLDPVAVNSTTHPWEPWTRPVYNMVHPRGAINDLAFTILGNPVHIKAELDPANRYAIRTTVSDINETLFFDDQKLTLWGLPADPAHASQRCADNQNIHPNEECPSGAEPRPFLTVPSQCEEANTWRLHHYDTWEHTGAYGPEIAYTQPGLQTDCERARFEPDVEIEPTGKQANTPTGLDVHITVAQNENPNALATPPVQRIEVTLPEGMSFSPSFADGLKSCTLAQMKLGTNDEVACPDASRIGEAEVSSPLLPKALQGSMYLAAQGDNPYGSTFALLLVLKDVEERGIIVKIPGRIDVDEQTGQITTTFEDTPQFPFDDFVLKFRSGPRAPLVSPPFCGSHEIGVEVASYAQPQVPVDASNAYEITEGPNGTPCPPEPSKRPFHPDFNGGTLNPVAGAFSTFLFRMSRHDDEQELSQVNVTLPPGLVAKIAGIDLCPDQAIASISTALGTGASELNSPACPASSFMGTISAGLGAGPGPNYFSGKAYLAGPYKGAPLSMAIVAPGLAGPFDLGNVVVRTALYVDPTTAQVKAVSDPFPTKLHGVILRVRDVRLRLDRDQTTINPTNCSQMSLNGEITGVGASLTETADDFLYSTSSPFQVGSCGDLAFKPKLALRLFGGTKRGSHPKFRAVARFGAGQANTKRASVALPHSEFLDQGHIRTVCTRVQFAAGACPQGSIYGTVKAKSPLLDEVVSGPIYLRSSNNPLPDLVATFRGGRIDVDLAGRIDSKNGGIRNTFTVVPDVPVSWAVFTFQGGKKGLLQNSRDICAGKTPRATAKFWGQNGRRHTFHPKLNAKCGKSRKAKRARRGHSRRR